MAGLMLGHGWTKTAIAKFLDPPDKTSPNPHYRNGAPVKLYLLARVKRKEKSKAYVAWLAESAARRGRAQATANKRRAATLAAVQAWEPRLGATMSMHDVTAAAITHYNHRSQTGPPPPLRSGLGPWRAGAAHQRSRLPPADHRQLPAARGHRLRACPR